MTYNYFNSGRLAFGKKITAAFNSLNELLNSAKEHVDLTIGNLSYYTGFNGKNYPTPEPITGNMITRTDELFDILNAGYFVAQLTCDKTKMYVKTTVFSKEYSRITCATGETEKRTGYAIVKLSTSLTDFNKSIRFSDSDDATTGEMTLFQFVCTDDTVLIKSPEKYNGLGIGEAIKYTSFSLTQIGSGSYTSDKVAECVLVKMGTSSGTVEENPSPVLKLNDNIIFRMDYTHHGRPFFILYLKNGDRITGDRVSTIYRINYNK